MLGPFQVFQQLSDIIVARSLWQAERTWMDDIAFPRLLLARLRNSPAKEMIDGSLERHSRAFHFFLQKRRHIVIESESCPHILMLARQAS